MTYYVNLGGILLYGIKNVEDNSEREITSYDGIGQGFFPVPESRKLRTWSFECEMTEQNTSQLPNWTAASKVFTGFEVLLATKDPSRFIFVSKNRNESMSGYLTGYSKKEEYPGIYNVTVKVTEYKAAGVKTTDVPYVKRPGKAPALPKVIVFDNKITPYSLDRKRIKDFEMQFGKIVNTIGSVLGKAKNAIDSTLDKLPWNRTPSISQSGTSQTNKTVITEKDTGKTVTNKAVIFELHPYTASFLSSQKPKEEGAKKMQNTFDWIGNTLKKWVEEDATKARNFKGGISYK
ncbi:MAG: hypothetical protein E7L17_14085 [Clostridium sp.]|uniref:hypothetical protein n=1 Tax=Clostridium sp. TaxID=1506 RepID=UPI002907F793|nr:hypothetical protein [Clostridium sp.]MDU7339228.1 hypothetical protein [Clostridium sp.]